MNHDPLEADYLIVGAGAAEICAYFGKVLRQRLLPSGRVVSLPSSDYGPEGTVTCRLSGARRQARARRCVFLGEPD